MNIERLRVGPDMANCYLLSVDEGPCLIVDFAVDDGNKTQEYCLRRFGGLAGILLTHGHYDHIAGLKGFHPDSNTRVLIHEDDAPCLADPRLNVSSLMFDKGIAIDQDLPLQLLEDEDEIHVGPKDGEGFDFVVMHTPFHTAGSVCYYFPKGKVLFSGDTLFCRGIGRYDLPGAKPRLREDSLRRLMALPEDTKVYPGHGPSTTIGQELRYNEALLALQ